jgi:phosphoribosylamine--glycine ligase
VVNVLVVGKGGREHALCWKLKQSPRVKRVFCAPGNAGTALEATNVPIEVGDTRSLIQFAKRENIRLTVVGPEDPLMAGIVDAFQKEGLRIFGPRQEAAELEGSKIFAKDLMRQAGIPTADYRVFRAAPDAERYILTRDVSLSVRPRLRSAPRGGAAAVTCRTAAEALEAIDRAFDPREGAGAVEIEGRGQRLVFEQAAEARRYVLDRSLNLVVKADGLAAGKGVVVSHTIGEAMEAIDAFMVRRTLGRAGDRILIEERLDGQEVSILALTDGRTIVPLEPCQDHKRAYDGDEGPNTGGMGAYCPTPIVTPDLMTVIEGEILVPAVHALKRARRAFRGLLYAGLILTNQGPKVLEFNVRFGDPEAQVLLMRLKSDLFEALDAVVEERLDEVQLEWDPRPALTVVMASDGYPGNYERGRAIHGLDDAERIPDVKVFHAGTMLRTDPVTGREMRVVTDGGRVLNVTALGETLRAAKERAYQAVSAIRFQGGWYRRDIGDRAIAAGA